MSYNKVKEATQLWSFYAEASLQNTLSHYATNFFLIFEVLWVFIVLYWIYVNKNGGTVAAHFEKKIRTLKKNQSALKLEPSHCTLKIK